MRTGNDYKQALIKMKPNVIIGGKTVGRDDDRLQGVIKTISETFDLAKEPEFSDLLKAQSHVVNKEVNRFTHIHQSIEDLLMKQEVTRKICQRGAGCIFRCMGIDAMNALSIITHRTEAMTGRPYNQRFLEYLKFWQEDNIVGTCAQTDPKGNRALRPHQQADPDLYLRVVEHKDDGIVVRGAKNHITAAAVAEEIVVVPTRFLTPEEDQYAVAFAVPGDWEGVKLVTRASNFKRDHFSCALGEFGDVENFIIFDDVFIPNDRVFLGGLEGEHVFGGYAAQLFALYHRHSYTGCKPAKSDIMTGLCALVSEYNGVEDKKHVQSKLAQLISGSELVYATGIAAAHKATRDDSGTMIPDPIFCNVARRHAGMKYYHELELLADLSGGLPATLPLEEDFFGEDVGPFLQKYIKRKEDVSSIDVYKLFRGISDILCSSIGGISAVAGVHGGGSPQMEDIAILKQYDVEGKKVIAKRLVGISDS
ncbi:MAG: 4-hydroxyphenylacetate 3-hydroxylase family protein [Candidatus Thorarchaeota archaeon]|jgi:4-hydroxyphenylacetate 3-monooxygenase/4-hydroxybutyryl-CoA dehydratase/vinylacetyl-CoA-Delta-isomerase